ncbi:HYR-like domain-containing protein, partial [Winogradskyella marincola]
CANESVITRTWTLTDECDNTTTLVQTITVVDTTAPTFTVPADITIECDVDPSDLSITGDVTDEADNCSAGLDATYTDSVANGTCANESVITRTWTLTDECDNTTTLVQTITVEDTIAPTFTVPADITIECDVDPSDLSITGDVTDEADNCSTGLEATYTDSVANGTCANESVITRTWTLTDECDNTTTLVQTITVEDTTPPSIDTINKEDIVIQCGVSPDNALDTWLSNNAGATATDNCGTITWSNDYGINTNVDCANGEIIVTFTATDVCGNASNTTATYSIIDTVDPVLTIPQDVTIECTESTEPSNTGNASATDDCTEPNITFNDSEVANCGNTKIITRTWTATDTCGNSVSANQTISVVDTTAPTFTVPADITIECDVDPSDLSITGDVTDEADNCSTGLEATYTDSVANGSCANESVITRTWTLTDECDNTTTLVQTITVEDTTAPTFTVPADITIECDVDPSDLSITGDVTDEADNCSTDLEATYTDSVANGSCANESVITRTWTLTDECDNTTTLVQTITVEDTTAPTFTVPADITIECDVDPSDLSITGDVTDEADNCSTGLEATYTDSVANGSCANESVITRTWTLTDECDNTTTLVQTITVEDTTAPTFTVPADITIECDVDPSDLSITGDVTDEADNCSTDLEATYTDSVANGSCANESVITRTWTLTDECDNTTTLVQTITVEDTTAPTFTVPADITIECDVDPSDLSITGDVTDEADNCSTGLEATYTDSVANGSCANESVITRTWTLTDECDNTTTLVQTITVEDTTAPTFNEALPTDVTVECDAVPTAETLTANDNCGDATVNFEEEITNSTCDNSYTLTRTWTAADACGNETVHSQSITVQDTTAPTFNEALPTDVTVECDAVPTAETLTANDNCGDATVTFEEEITNSTCDNSYTLTRTWTAADACGNETVHSQSITVQDTTAPTFNEALPTDVTVECDAVPTAETLTANDNCDDATVTFEEEITNSTCDNSYTLTRIW